MLPSASSPGPNAKGLYRSPSPARPHGTEAEAAAAAEISRRASRLHKLVIVPCILAGLALGIVGYFVVRDIQIGLIHGHVPFISGTVGVGSPIAGMFWLAERLARIAIAARKNAWLEDVSKIYGVPVEALEDYTALL